MRAAVEARERTKVPPEAKRATVTAERRALVALVGNPNTGKTTLFNALTGERARVGNYPGVTVERRVGRLRLRPGRDAPALAREIDVLDLPGTYSLSARSAEEQIALAGVLGLSGHPAPDLAVVVVDAGQLLRNLYLVLQLCELEVPLVVALNMIDEVAGGEPDVASLAEWLGAPVVATNARDGVGIEALRRAVAEALVAPHAPAPAFSVPYAAALRRDVEALRPFVLPLLSAAQPPASARATPAARDRGVPDVESDSRVQSPVSPAELGAQAGSEAAPVGRAGALALWALGSVDRDDELVDIDPTLRARALELQARAHADGRDVDAEIIATRYELLDAEVPRLFARTAEPGAAEQPTDARSAARAQTEKEDATTATGDAAPPARRRSLPLLGARQAPPPASEKRRALTDRIDRVVLHPVVGFVVFVALMLLMFQALFSWSAPLVSLIEDAFGWLGAQTRAALPAGFVSDLLVQGVIGGVGNVLVFLPQIILLFLFISVLEDSGYMARAAYLMDRVMRALGLHGRAFVPMLSGCACAVPAILATRTMERQRDRLLTMLVVPLMTCSARLPVYTLLIAALFPAGAVLGFLPVQGLLMVAMYLFSTLVALGAAAVLRRTVVKGESVPLLLELPPYRLPTARSVVRQVKERALVFLKEAGTVILACTVALWVLLSYPKPATPEPVGPPEAVAAWQAERLEHSIAGRLGKGIEPAIAPLGFDWKIGVGLVGAFAAREVFVSTMGVVYGVGGDDEEVEPLREKIKADVRPDGQPKYTPLVGLSLMVFFALACQCMSTLAVVRRETKTWKWPAFLFAYTGVLAYVASLLVYQLGRLFGLAG